jgi:hypothetical protein
MLDDKPSGTASGEVCETLVCQFCRAHFLSTVSTAQAYHYYTVFPRDHIYLKSVVRPHSSRVFQQ